jgi:hypothetical protein
MAEPIVRSFVIDTTQAEQNLQRLDAVTTATNASLDGLYNQLISLDAQLQQLDPNSQAFAEVNTQIQQLETTITGIETGKIDDIGKAIESIDSGTAAQSIEQVGNAVEQVVAPVKNLADATDQLNTQLKDIPKDVVPDEIIPPDLVPPDVIENTKSLKQQLQELQVELANTDPNSEKYQELATAAGELKNRIATLSTVVGTQAGSAFERIGGSLELVKSSIAKLDFKGAAENAKLLATNISAVKPAELASGFKSLGQSFLSVGKALLSNPLFLLGSAVVLIITNLDKLANVIPGVGAVLETIGSVVSFIVDGVKSLTDAIGVTEFAANDALNKSLEQREKASKEFDQQEKRAIANARKNGESVAAVEEKYAQERIKSYQKIIDEAAFLTSQGVKLSEEQIKGVEEANAALFDIETKQIEKQAELAEQARKAQAELAEQAQKEQEAKEQEASNRRKQNAQKRADEAKARREKELEDQRKAEEAYYNGIAALQDEQFEKTLTQNEKEELAITEKYENLFALADAAGKDTIDLQTQLNAELLALQQKQAEAEIAAEAEKERLKTEEKLKASEDYYTKLAALEAENLQSTLTDQEKEELAVADKYKGILEAAALFNSLLKEGEEAQRIDTAAVEEQQGAELAGIKQKYIDADVEAAREAEAEKLAETIASIDKGLQYAEQGLNAISALNDIFFSAKLSKAKKGSKEEEALAKKQFKFQKALQLGAATIDAAKSITASLASAPVAIGPVPNPAGIASLALASISGAATIRKIAMTKFEGGGGGGGVDTPTASIGGGGGGDTGSQPAQFNPLASSFLQDRPEQLTPRAYVLSGDVASQQEVRTKVEDLARIG